MLNRYAGVRLLRACLLFAVASLAPAALFAGTIFWKASSPSATVYLLGSVHIATPALYPLPKNIENAYENADCLVVEANVLAATEDMSFITMVQEKGFYNDGKTLHDHIPPSFYNAFADACARQSIPVDTFAPMRPWLAAVNYEQMVLLQLGFDPSSGIDMHFLLRASGKKEILELESVDFQLNLFSSLDDDLQMLLLKATVDESRQLKEGVGQILDYWKQGNGEKLAAMANEPFVADGPRAESLARRLITERNYNMASKIERYLSTGKTYFVVVGAGHLLGKEGIIALLRNKGFTVVPL